MFGLGSKNIGGFKVVIGRKTNHSYQIVATVLIFFLLVLVVSDILYISRAFSAVFNERVGVDGGSRSFNLVGAEKNPKLNAAESDLQSLEELFPDLEISPSPIATTSPGIQE